MRRRMAFRLGVRRARPASAASADASRLMPALSVFVAVLALPVPAVAATPRGALRQLVGARGCLVAVDPPRGCGELRNVEGATDLALSPDGRHAYVTASGSGTVVAFSRDVRRGRLVQLVGGGACVSARRRPGCATVRALRDPEAIAVSGDGRSVYVTAGNQSVAVFARDPRSGTLVQLPGPAGCLSRRLDAGCTVVRGLRGGRPVVGPDDRQVYIASAAFESQNVLTLNRSVEDGSLTQAPGEVGCTSRSGVLGCRRGRGLLNAATIAFSPDRAWGYVPSRAGNVALFRRQSDGALEQLSAPLGCISADLPTRFCLRVRAINEANDAVVSADGRHVYVAAFARGVASFARNPFTGALSQLPGRSGCVSSMASRVCARARAIILSSGTGTTHVALARDGRTLYASSATHGGGGGIAVLRRDPTTGTLRELPGRAGCLEGGRPIATNDDYTVRIRRAPRCAPVRGLDESQVVALSPDGRYAYALGDHVDDGDTLAVFSIHTGGPATSEPPGHVPR